MPGAKKPRDSREHRKVFGWYEEEEIVVDNFTYEQIGSHYAARPCERIGKHMVAKAYAENISFITVCIPSYNEDLEEMHKTMLSLLQNADYYKKARLTDTPLGLAVEEEFQRTIPVLVPIFDGVKAMSAGMKHWLKTNFDGVFDELLFPPPPPPIDTRRRRRRRAAAAAAAAAEKEKNKPKNDPQEVHVRAACRRWWYYSRDIIPRVEADGAEDEDVDPSDLEAFEDHLIPFYVVPIVKKNNHRKHNSHQWFFDSVCHPLRDTCTYAFLTDCGTTYEPSCLAILFKELCINPDLIGVTARQRVEWPNKYFHPCESAPYEFLTGDHSVDKNPCWKCYLCYLCGPSVLQGFEFEAALVTNLSIFNLVEALPVMPGPCQLMNWQKMKHFQVVKEYFSLLFKSEINKKEMVNVPLRYHKMVDEEHDDDFSDNESEFHSESDSEDEEEDEEEELYPGYDPLYGGHMSMQTTTVMMPVFNPALNAMTMQPVPMMVPSVSPSLSSISPSLFPYPSPYPPPYNNSPYNPYNPYNSPYNPFSPMTSPHSSYYNPHHHNASFSSFPSPLLSPRTEKNSNKTNHNESSNTFNTAAKDNESGDKRKKSKRKNSEGTEEKKETEADEGKDSKENDDENKESKDKKDGQEPFSSHNPIAKSNKRPVLNFTEFLRTNMRLAEDRVLSFVSVFSTRYGTKWIPGATFYYTPEVKWSTLLLQRRRWINGTFASFLFFLWSKRAATRLDARMFDSQSLSKVFVLFLWRLQLFQMMLVFITPAIFGSTCYISLIDLGGRFPAYWAWTKAVVFAAESGSALSDVLGAHVWMMIAFLIFATWTIYAHFAPSGRIPEVVCHLLAIVGVVYMVPVYWSLYSAMLVLGVGFVAGLVLFSILSPAIISVGESWKCVQLYLMYLPWFISLMVFFLILVPSYSFARLYDTTWGNRATGNDSAIHDSEEITMRRWNLLFIVFVITMNFFLTFALVQAISAGYNIVLILMIFVFVPAVIQLCGAVVFWIRTFFFSQRYQDRLEEMLVAREDEALQEELLLLQMQERGDIDDDTAALLGLDLCDLTGGVRSDVRGTTVSLRQSKGWQREEEEREEEEEEEQEDEHTHSESERERVRGRDSVSGRQSMSSISDLDMDDIYAPHNAVQQHNQQQMYFETERRERPMSGVMPMVNPLRQRALLSPPPQATAASAMLGRDGIASLHDTTPHSTQHTTAHMSQQTGLSIPPPPPPRNGVLPPSFGLPPQHTQHSQTLAPTPQPTPTFTRTFAHNPPVVAVAEAIPAEEDSDPAMRKIARHEQWMPVRTHNARTHKEREGDSVSASLSVVSEASLSSVASSLTRERRKELESLAMNARMRAVNKLAAAAANKTSSPSPSPAVAVPLTYSQSTPVDDVHTQQLLSPAPHTAPSLEQTTNSQATQPFLNPLANMQNQTSLSTRALAQQALMARSNSELDSHLGALTNTHTDARAALLLSSNTQNGF